MFCLTLFSSELFCSVLPCHFLSRVVSCCTDTYRIVSAFYCSIIYAILRNAPLWGVCYTAQYTLYSFLRLLCFKALPYCSVLVYPLKYIIIHKIYHAPWCVRSTSIFYPYCATTMFTFSSLLSLPSDDEKYVDIRGCRHFQRLEVVPVCHIRKLPRTSYDVCLAFILIISYAIYDVKS